MGDGPSSPEQSQPTKAAIREFSRSTPEGIQARTETAQKILGLRKDSRQHHAEKVGSLTESQQRSQQVLEYLKQEREQILLLKASLADSSTSWLVKARSLFDKVYRDAHENMLKSMQPEVGASLKRNQNKQENYDQVLMELERKFQELAENYKPFQIGGDTLRRFYLNQRELFKERQIKLDMNRQKVELEVYRQEHGTVAEVAKEHGAYIVHGITLSPGGTNNPILEHHATWRDKLMVVASVNPPLSASAFKEGSGPQFLWGGGIGVLIRDGVIAEAEASDLVTVSTSISEKKSSLHGAYNIEVYKEHLERALNKKNESWGYNEILLEFGAKPGAVYINLDQTGKTAFEDKGLVFEQPYYDYDNRIGKGKDFGRLDRLDYSEIFEAATFVGLPVVAIRNGVVYRAFLNDAGGIVVSDKISPEDVTKLQTKIPEENLPEIQRISTSVLKTLAVA